MKNKSFFLTIVLSLSLFLMSSTGSARIFLYCDGAQAYLVNTDLLINVVVTAGGCAGGVWMVELSVAPTGGSGSGSGSHLDDVVSLLSVELGDEVGSEVIPLDIMNQIINGEVEKVYIASGTILEETYEMIKNSSEFISIEMDGVAPNPVIEKKVKFNIKSDREQQVQVRIYGVNTGDVYEIEIDLNEGDNIKEVDVPSNFSGLYTLIIISDINQIEELISIE